MAEKPFFESDVTYLLYQIYPVPENPSVLESVDRLAKYHFVNTNSLYFIITEESYKKIQGSVPRWITINKVSPVGIEDILKLDPNQKEIFKDARIWAPPKCTGVGRGNHGKRKQTFI
jgi:hypothetical protein